MSITSAIIENEPKVPDILLKKKIISLNLFYAILCERKKLNQSLYNVNSYNVYLASIVKKYNIIYLSPS